MNIEKLELNKEYTWKQICELIDIPYKTGNTKIKQMKQFESLCRFTKEKTKFTIHEIYNKPKEIEDGRKNNRGSDVRSAKYEPLDDQLFAMFDDILENNSNLPIIEDKTNELYKVYLWTSEIKKVTGMVNSEFKGNRNDTTKTHIKESVKNITPYEKYKKNIKEDIKNEEEILIKEYEKYVDESVNLIFNDIFPTCKQRTDEMLHGALGRLEKQHVIFVNRAYMLQFKYETGEYDEDGNEIILYCQQYTNGVEETAVIDNIRLSVIEDWNKILERKKFIKGIELKIYKYFKNRKDENGNIRKISNMNDIPNDLLNIFNKCFKEKMIKKFGDSAMYFDGAFACNEVLINKKMMNFKYDDNKRKQIITCKKDLTNKKKINQLVTTSLVNTFKKKIENSKNDTSSFSNKKYDKVRNDFEEIYLTTVEDKVRIDFKKDNSEILRLSSPKIKNESDTIINLLKDDDDKKNIK
jgi:hypothetical protein